MEESTDTRLAIRAKPEQLNRLFMILSGLPLLLFLAGFIFSGRVHDLAVLVDYPSSLIIMCALLAIFIAHELLHYIAFRAVGIDATNIALKPDRDTLSVCVVINSSISVRDWRLSLAAPFVVLTPILAIAAFVTPYLVEVSLLLALSLAGCSYDLAVLYGLSGQPGSARVLPEMRNDAGRLFLFRE